MLIRYIGNKTQKADNVAGTGIVWLPGEDKEVPNDKAMAFLVHTTVWEPSPAKPAEPEPKFILEVEMKDGAKETFILDDMDNTALRAFSVKYGINVDKRKCGDDLRQLIVDTALKQE